MVRLYNGSFDILTRTATVTKDMAFSTDYENAEQELLAFELHIKNFHSCTASLSRYCTVVVLLATMNSRQPDICICVLGAE